MRSNRLHYNEICLADIVIKNGKVIKDRFGGMATLERAIGKVMSQFFAGMAISSDDILAVDWALKNIISAEESE